MIGFMLAVEPVMTTIGIVTAVTAVAASITGWLRKRAEQAGLSERERMRLEEMAQQYEKQRDEMRNRLEQMLEDARFDKASQQEFILEMKKQAAQVEAANATARREYMARKQRDSVPKAHASASLAEWMMNTGARRHFLPSPQSPLRADLGMGPMMQQGSPAASGGPSMGDLFGAGGGGIDLASVFRDLPGLTGPQQAQEALPLLMQDPNDPVAASALSNLFNGSVDLEGLLGPTPPATPGAPSTDEILTRGY